MIALGGLLWIGAMLDVLTQGAPPASPPNILVVVLDDIGIDKATVYERGGSQFAPKMPHLSSLAGSGVRFTQAWVCPSCSPTRASLLTGRYPFRHGIGDALFDGDPLLGPLSQEEVLLPALLDFSTTKFTSGAFGKWHLDWVSLAGQCAPIERGFDAWAGVILNLTTAAAFDQFPKWVYTQGGCVSSSSLPSLPGACTSPAQFRYATTDTVNEALHWIGAQSGPWFCYLALHAAHSPHHRPPDGLYIPPVPPLANPFPTAESPAPYYQAMCEAVDTELGRMLACLASNEQLAETVVIVLGDNGTPGTERVDNVLYDLVFPPFDPLRDKGSVYEGGIRVPLIVSAPWIASPGRTSNALVHAVDVFATIIDLAQVDLESLGFGCDQPLGVSDGLSFLPLLLDSAVPFGRNWNYTERFLPNFDSHARAGASPGEPPPALQRTIRNQRFKLIRTQPQAGTGLAAPPPKCDLPLCEQLFDLESDPWEMRDLLLPQSPHYDTEAALNLEILRHRMDTLLQGCP